MRILKCPLETSFYQRDITRFMFVCIAAVTLIKKKTNWINMYGDNNSDDTFFGSKLIGCLLFTTDIIIFVITLDYVYISFVCECLVPPLSLLEASK